LRLGPHTFHVLSHPEHARRVLHVRRNSYDKTGRASLETRLLAGRSLLVANGERWQRTRRLMNPAFRLNNIARYAPAMTASALDMLRQWRERGRAPVVLDLAEEMMRVTYRIVGRALLGDDLLRTAESVEQAMEATLGHVYRRIEGLAFPIAWPTPGNRKFVRERANLHAVVDGILGRRRASGCPVHDLLDSLMQARDADGSGDFDDAWLRDEVVTLMLAGHKTTANALTWSWHLLSLHPEIERQVHEEARALLNGRAPTFDELERLPYARQVVEEAMRLYPPIWAMERRALEEDEIGGFAIPKGGTVIVASYVMHRHPEFWDRPERFDPERFTATAAAKRPDYLYLPFGSGPRVCIGMSFALAEATLLLATVIQQCRLLPAPGAKVIPQPGITLGVRDGLPMRLVWREEERQ